MSALVWVAGRAGDVGDERDLVTRQAPLPIALCVVAERGEGCTRDARPSARRQIHM